jgi:hypothetical protein
LIAALAVTPCAALLFFAFCELCVVAVNGLAHFHRTIFVVLENGLLYSVTIDCIGTKHKLPPKMGIEKAHPKTDVL